MDALLARLGVQAVNYAMRCGIALTSTFAVQQCSRLLKTVDDKSVHSELKSLQKVLDSKIKIISPALDLIEFKSGRGNVILGNAASLAKSLHRDIVALAKRLERAAEVEEVSRAAGNKATTSELRHAELLVIIHEIKRLLDRIDRDAQLILLAISSSGESLSTSVPQAVSPSRLLQASAFLMFGDTQFASDPNRPVQIGPTFTLSLYMLFLGHTSSTQQEQTSAAAKHAAHRENVYGYGEGERLPIWQEVIHKSRVRLCRTPLDWEFDPKHGYRPKSGNQDLEGRSVPFFGRPDQFAYHLEVIEDLDDGRVHDEDSAGWFDDILRAGIRTSIPIYQISKIFYTDTGRILNIGNSKDFENNPALLLKRDVNAPAPSRILEQMIADEWSTSHYGDSNENISADEQADIDRQLREESEPNVEKKRTMGSDKYKKWALPPHLDAEWLAFEVFMDDEEDDESDSDDEVDENAHLNVAKVDATKRSSLDSKLITQIRDVSLRSSPSPGPQVASRPSSSEVQDSTVDTPELFVARSPFGSITSSLSLMEMLIRLTSLQEFQQASYLAMTDHILSFFLEESSTTGLRGREQWEVRNEAKRKVGFDPYTDTPSP